MTTVQIIGIIFVIVAAIAIGLGVAVTLIRRDRGMMTIVGVWDPKCIPLTLLIDEQLDELRPRVRQALNEMIPWWNNALGFEAFVPLDSVGPGDPVPFMPAGNGTEYGPLDDALALMHHTYDGNDRIMIAAVYVDIDRVVAASRAELLRGMANELGHLLGLARDDNEASVMYGKATSTAFELTTADRELLRGIYGGDHA